MWIAFFSHGGIMRGEFDELYNALFSNAELYISVVKALAQHHDGMTRTEISKVIGANGGTLTRVLTNLERCDLSHAVRTLVARQRYHLSVDGFLYLILL